MNEREGKGKEREREGGKEGRRGKGTIPALMFFSLRVLPTSVQTSAAAQINVF